MTFEQGMQGQSSAQGSGGWGGLLSGALPLPVQLGLSLGTGFGSGLLNPTAHHDAPDKDAAPKEVGGKKDASQPGAAQAQAGIKELDKKDRPPPSREELMKNPELYGKPKDMPAAAFASQYADEYLAKLAYKDPTVDPSDVKSAVPGYTAADKKFLADWGYKFSTDVRDAKTGLYVAKFDPVDPKSGVAPVVAFRGSEGGSPDTREIIKDAQADLGYSYVGQNQYEAKKAEIAKLFQDPNGQKVDVTGHSLGGALAQKAAADNIASTHGLTTFQAPGILKADADKFAKENQKYGVEVNHHYATTDLVHRAGEAKLGGNFWEHTLPGVKGPDELGKFQLPKTIDDVKRSLSLGLDMGKGIGESHTTHDLLSDRSQQISLHKSDPQSDRAQWEGLRKEAGKRINDTHLVDATLSGLDAKQHLSNAGSAWQTGKDSAGAAWNQGLAGAKDGVGEVGQGFSDLAHLDVKKGLSEIGHGAGSGLGSAVHGTAGAASSLWQGAKGAVGQVGGALSSAKATGGGLVKSAKGLFGLFSH